MHGGIRIWAITVRAFVTALALLVFTTSTWGQPLHKLHAESVDLQLISAYQNPDNPNDLIVTVRVTIHAAGQLLVVPNCSEKSTDPRFFCMALLRRKNGKTIKVRRGLAATLGVENPDIWKPVTIARGAEDSFLFSCSTGLLDVKPGEPVRVAFEVWPNAESVKDWKLATTLMSPVFRCPSKQD
jgi:hypothetical protein